MHPFFSFWSPFGSVGKTSIDTTTTKLWANVSQVRLQSQWEIKNKWIIVELAIKIARWSKLQFTPPAWCNALVDWWTIDPIGEAGSLSSYSMNEKAFSSVSPFMYSRTYSRATNCSSSGFEWNRKTSLNLLSLNRIGKIKCKCNTFPHFSQEHFLRQGT